jgi:hypothetical protein
VKVKPRSESSPVIVEVKKKRTNEAVTATEEKEKETVSNEKIQVSIEHCKSW